MFLRGRLSIKRFGYLFICYGCITLIVAYFLLPEKRYIKQSNSLQQTNAKILQYNDINTKTESENSGRFILAFSYWEQLSGATNSLFQLTALAAHGRRQVVLPFVANSSLIGMKLDEHTATLGAYYNVQEFNHVLRSYGYNTFVSWETFQATCKKTLDVLLDFRYANSRHSSGTREKTGPKFFRCDLQNKRFNGFEIVKTICVDTGAFQSFQQFENEVVKDLPCVGIKQWRGTGNPYRTNFSLQNPRGFKERLASVFNASLVQIAQDFITKKLQPGFISIHIRSETMTPDGKDLSLLKKCLSELTTKVLQTIATDPSRPLHNLKIFLASDISAHGSYSGRMLAARKHGVDFIFKEYLSVLNATTFQPSSYKLTDRGSAAIVEMIILRQGKMLFLYGGGSFQGWIKYQYIAWNPRGLKDVYFGCI